MAVLSKADNSWRVIDNITGEGVDVNCVDFSDLNNDGTEEIIVCWGIISKSTTSNLCVYSTDESLKLNLVTDLLQLVSLFLSISTATAQMSFWFSTSAVIQNHLRRSFIHFHREIKD